MAQSENEFKSFYGLTDEHFDSISSKYMNGHTECIEEIIFLEETGQSHKYFLSNNFDEIKKAIKIETRINIELDFEIWVLNTELSKDVKELMKKHQIIYSMTTGSDGNFKYFTINKRIGDDWFIIKFDERYGFVSQGEENFDEKVDNLFKVNNSGIVETETIVYPNINLQISFCNKKNKDISNIIPLINKIYISNKCNYLLNFVEFNALNKNKPKNLIAKYNDFECYYFILDKPTELFTKMSSAGGNKLIGLKLNHFLPDFFIYSSINPEIGIIALTIKIELEKIFHDKNDQIDEESIKKFNDYILKLSKYINENLNQKKINFTQFIIPENIINKNKSLSIKKTIERINKCLIDCLIHYCIDSNKRFDSGIDDEYIFPYVAEPAGLGIFMEGTVRSIKNFFLKNIIYLGPLREEPHLQYNDYFDNIINIGVKGENCACVLYNNKKNIIKYINPLYFYQYEKKIILMKCELIKAVNEWLYYIGVAESVDVFFNGRYGYEIKINSINRGNKNDMTNVGVGVSQVLPIVLVCLLAKEGTTIIIEQPELHLHPAMQTKITDLFIATMLCNKQIIIETHSEHIINKLRLSTIKCPSEEPINDKIQIYFTENLKEDYKDYKKGNTILKPLKINEYAAMSDWPEGFFDESQLVREEIIEEVGKKLEKDFPDE
jgi:predicted ATPase